MTNCQIAKLSNCLMLISYWPIERILISGWLLKKTVTKKRFGRNLGVWSLNTKLRQLEAFFGKIVAPNPLCPGILLSILSILIYNGSQTDACNKSYGHLKFSCQFCWFCVFFSVDCIVSLFSILSVYVLELLFMSLPKFAKSACGLV